MVGPIKPVSKACPTVLPILRRFSLLCLSRGRPCTWIQNSKVEKSTSAILCYGLKCFKIKCSPLISHGLLSQAHLTSASCLKENTKTFLSTSETSTSFRTFQAFVKISLTRALRKDFFERILPMRRCLEDSLDEGTTSRLTLFFSQLNLDAWEVIESTFTSSMAQSHKQTLRQTRQTRETRYREENYREAEWSETSTRKEKERERERARGREMKREGNTKDSFTEKTQVSHGERRLHMED